MTKMQIAEEITRKLLENDAALHAGKITPSEWHDRITDIYNHYKPDVNVWRKACKDKTLRKGDIYLPMRDC